MTREKEGGKGERGKPRIQKVSVVRVSNIREKIQFLSNGRRGKRGGGGKKRKDRNCPTLGCPM